jgi:hypothetical protein
MILGGCARGPPLSPAPMAAWRRGGDAGHGGLGEGVRPHMRDAAAEQGRHRHGSAGEKPLLQREREREREKQRERNREKQRETEREREREREREIEREKQRQRQR